MKTKELIEAAEETLNTKSTGSDIELACSLLNQARTALAAEQKEKRKIARYGKRISDRIPDVRFFEKYLPKEESSFLGEQAHAGEGGKE